MILTLKNVAKIKEAKIKLNDITVIAGYNSTGKSSISKALYGLVLPFCDMNLKIKYEKEKSLKFVLSEFLSKHSLPSHYLQPIMFTLNESIEKDFVYPKSISFDTFKNLLLHHLEHFELFTFLQSRNNQEIDHTEFLSYTADLYKIINETLQKDDINFLTRVETLTLSNLFNKQLVTKSNNAELSAILTLDFDDNISLSINYQDEGLKAINLANPYQINKNIIYIETVNIIDSLNNNYPIIKSHDSNFYRNNLIELLQREPKKDTELSEEEEQQQTIFKTTFETLFQESLQGELIKQGEYFYFKELNSDELIDTKNISSGMKCLLVIQRLIQNDTINKNTILVIDEPETNLHPDWQVLLANILVLLNKLLGIKILINSHSPYFIRALEVKMATNGMANEGNYYLMTPSDDGLFTPKNVTNSTEEIYHYLYKPLESLTL